jgi:hypothetical protein
VIITFFGLAGCASRPSAFEFEEKDVDSIRVDQLGAVGTVRSCRLHADELHRLAHAIHTANPPDHLVLKVEQKYIIRIYLTSARQLLFVSNGRLISQDSTANFMVLPDTVRLIEPCY